jgi:hypothetical protein
VEAAEKTEFVKYLRSGDFEDVRTEVDPGGKEKMYMKIKTGKRITVPMDALTQDEANLLKLLDSKDSGQITMQDIVRAQEQKLKGEKEAKIMKKIIIGLTILLLVLFLGMFAITLSVVEMAKEMRSDDNGVMMTSSSMVAKMGTNDREVSPSGELVQPSGTSTRRLQDGSRSLRISKCYPHRCRILTSNLWRKSPCTAAWPSSKLASMVSHA